jgi:hypothetical protein
MENPRACPSMLFFIGWIDLVTNYYGWMDALMNEWIGGGPGGQMDD